MDALPDHHAAARRVWSLRQTLDSLKSDKAMQADRVRLARACSSPTKSTGLIVLRFRLLSLRSALQGDADGPLRTLTLIAGVIVHR